MSSIAVPVVSEPVPAVVGTAIRGNKVLVIGKPFPTGALMKSMRSESLYTEKLWKKIVKCRYAKRDRANTYRFAALAVSMTLPPPTLKVHRVKKRQLRKARNARQEVTEVMLTSPGYCLTPAVLRWFSHHLIKYFKWKINLRFQGSNSLLLSKININSCCDWLKGSLFSLPLVWRH